MLSQLITGGLLASLAVGVAFGPELVRTIARLRAGAPRRESTNSDESAPA
jgi:hypothetical protein